MAVAPPRCLHLPPGRRQHLGGARRHHRLSPDEKDLLFDPADDKYTATSSSTTSPTRSSTCDVMDARRLPASAMTPDPGPAAGLWTGHGPVLEEDIALTNIGLDQIGQARAWLTLAGRAENADRDEDKLAYFRDQADFRNALLCERPNGHFGDTIVRQFLFDAYAVGIHEGLCRSTDDETSRPSPARAPRKAPITCGTAGRDGAARRRHGGKPCKGPAEPE